MASILWLYLHCSGYVVIVCGYRPTIMATVVIIQLLSQLYIYFGVI